MLGTDRESEQWWIEALADRQRAKWPLDKSPRRYGYYHRKMRSWYAIGMALAAIQEEYDRGDDCYPRHLMQRTLMAIWPMMMPYSWPPTKRLTRKRILKARERVTPLLLTLATMANRVGATFENFDFPRIIVRARKKTERLAQTRKSDADDNRNYAAEVIGRAVLQEYRRHPPERRSLESSFAVVAAQGSIEDIATNSERSVEARYHAFRKLAFERGFADSRAYWCSYEEKPWPDDHVWLEDFPATNDATD